MTSDGDAPAMAGLLRDLRTFQGSPGAFWPVLARTSVRLASARTAIVAMRPTEADEWRKIAEFPDRTADEIPWAEWVAVAQDAAPDAGEAVRLWTPAGGGEVRLAAVRLDLPQGTGSAVVIAALPGEGGGLAELRSAAAAAAAWTLGRQLDRARQDVQHFASALDLIALVNAETRFMAAAMTVCNELSARHHCDRVSLGWFERRQIRVKAVSHIEKFERKMEAVQRLETAMEEAFDQDEEIVWPRPPDAKVVARDHEIHAADQGAVNLCSLPVRVDGRGVGVLLLERRMLPFGEDELRHLRLHADQCARRLADLHSADRWFGARWAASIRDGLAQAFGPRHTGAKAAAVAGALALAWLVFGRMPARIEAPFTLRAEQASVLPAPFDGYLESVLADLGAAVTAGMPLARLDTRDLLLEETAALADRNRYLREADKARAAGVLADMRIATAQADQAEAKLAMIRRRLDQAVIRAPMDSALVEGDLRERAGAPVRTGDLLFRTARLDRLYAEVLADEADIDRLSAGASGMLAFASRPDLRFPVRVVRIDPVAEPVENRNVFRVRCVATGPSADWWRPGMSGEARLEAGRRSPLWVLTHRTTDFLRLRFWW